MNKLLLESVKKHEDLDPMHIQRKTTETIHTFFNNKDAAVMLVWNGFQDSHRPYYYYRSYIPELNIQSYRNTRETTPGGNNGIFDFEAILF
jgi:hypothetical protein